MKWYKIYCLLLLFYLCKTLTLCVIYTGRYILYNFLEDPSPGCNDSHQSHDNWSMLSCSSHQFPRLWPVPIYNGKHPTWSPCALPDLVDHVVDGEASGGQLVGVADILQAPDVLDKEDLVALEDLGLARI